jgi:hypothetical protein
MKHLRQHGFESPEKSCAAIADEQRKGLLRHEAHAVQKDNLAFFSYSCGTGCALLTRAILHGIHGIQQYSTRRPTAGVTRWWAGRDNATLTEPTPSHANCLKTRRLPPVGCTLCWAAFSLRDNGCIRTQP